MAKAEVEVEVPFAKRELLGVGLMTLGSPNATSPGLVISWGAVKTQSGVRTGFTFESED